MAEPDISYSFSKQMFPTFVHNAVSGLATYLTQNSLASGYGLQSAGYGLELEQLHGDYISSRNQLVGGVYAAAGANGVKVSGSVAESLVTSLTEMGIEESRKKYNIEMQKINAEYSQRLAKGQRAAGMISAIGNTATSLLAGYNTWGDK